MTVLYICKKGLNGIDEKHFYYVLKPYPTHKVGYKATYNPLEGSIIAMLTYVIHMLYLR